jgi:hypothetical protein
MFRIDTGKKTPRPKQIGPPLRTVQSITPHKQVSGRVRSLIFNAGVSAQ